MTLITSEIMLLPSICIAIKSTDSYCQFVQGYANTEHADI